MWNPYHKPKISPVQGGELHLTFSTFNAPIPLRLEGSAQLIVAW